jgi:DeoR/GlpR family transcriptional regulator of sugar metabolism
MSLSETQKEILQILVKTGAVKNQDLMKELKISPSTLYYSIDTLIGLCIKRKRGGLELVTQPTLEAKNTFYEKLEVDRKEKEELAETIIKSSKIDYSNTLLLDCGTTNYILAEKLIEDEKKGLNIISLNPYVLKKLLDFPEIGHIRAVGGTINITTGALFGPMTVDSLNSLQEIGTLIIGIDSINQNGEMGIVNEFEVKQKKIMLEKARSILIPITRSKLDRAVSYSIGNIAEFKGNKTLFVFIYGKPSEDNITITKLQTILGKEFIVHTGG